MNLKKNAPFRKRSFIDVMGGESSLAAAMKARGFIVKAFTDFPQDEQSKGFDISSLAAFRKLMTEVRSGKVWWMHLAPPFCTFTRAKRKDGHGMISQVRSTQQPWGTGAKDTWPSWVREANFLASRSLKLAKAQAQQGHFFTIENPADSYLWALPPFVQLAKAEGIRQVVGLRSKEGGKEQRTTRWLCNGEWFGFLATWRQPAAGAESAMFENCWAGKAKAQPRPT